VPANKLFEGLRKGDLKDCVESIFTVDQYTSKMGMDRDVAVLRFRVKDKFPAIDMMEFIEKGYPFVLDADISSGEERDGKYSVFVEMERSKQLPGQIRNLLDGISLLTDHTDWRFRFYKDIESRDFTEQSLSESIPLTPDAYDATLNESKHKEVGDFFSEGAVDSIDIDESMNVTFKKAFGESLKINLVCIGSYDDVKNFVKGGVQVDESSASETVFLTKYLGNYEIHKIDGQFIVRKGNEAAVIKLI